MVLLMPQFCGQVTIHRCQLGESCIPCFCSRHKIHEGILHFAILDIFGTSISCHSGRLFEILYVQVGLLKMHLELHPYAIIGRDTIPHAVRMCIFLRFRNFFYVHVCELPIRNGWFPITVNSCPISIWSKRILMGSL